MNTPDLDPPHDPVPLEPQQAFLQLAQIRFDDTDLEGVLLTVADLAKQAIVGVADVSVTLVRDQKAFTAAFTGEDALNLDESQYEPGHGPCLDIAQASGTLLIDDMQHETRWPMFTARARTVGVLSSLSVSLPVQESVVGALNLYSHQVSCFDPGAVELAQTFAGYAAVAIANAHLYEASATLADNMRKAMETRAVIEQAKGVLMARAGLDATQAFELLTRQSQQSNRKLRVIAAEVVADAAKAATG